MATPGTPRTAARAPPRRWGFSSVISLVRRAIDIFIAKNAPSRGAALAFYAVTSIAPVLLIVIAVAGAAFGEEAARPHRVTYRRLTRD